MRLVIWSTWNVEKMDLFQKISNLMRRVCFHVHGKDVTTDRNSNGIQLPITDVTLVKNDTNVISVREDFMIARAAKIMSELIPSAQFDFQIQTLTSYLKIHQIVKEARNTVTPSEIPGY